MDDYNSLLPYNSGLLGQDIFKSDHIPLLHSNDVSNLPPEDGDERQKPKEGEEKRDAAPLSRENECLDEQPENNNSPTTG